MLQSVYVCACVGMCVHMQKTLCVAVHVCHVLLYMWLQCVYACKCVGMDGGVGVVIGVDVRFVKGGVISMCMFLCW